MVRSRHRSGARRWIASVTALALIAVAGLIPASSVAAAEPNDSVLVWNTHAVAAIGNPVSPPAPIHPRPPRPQALASHRPSR